MQSNSVLNFQYKICSREACITKWNHCNFRFLRSQDFPGWLPAYLPKILCILAWETWTLQNSKCIPWWDLPSRLSFFLLDVLVKPMRKDYFQHQVYKSIPTYVFIYIYTCTYIYRYIFRWFLPYLLLTVYWNTQFTELNSFLYLTTLTFPSKGNKRV